LFGYDTGVVGSALPLVQDDLGHFLSYSEQEIITAATTIGAVFGGAILGTLADRLGRKWCLLIADVWYVDRPRQQIWLKNSFTAGAIVISASYSVPQIIIGRLILGVGVGGAAVIAPL
jgi:SP family myo-inositol transporter-like MFS transporter 13